MIESIFLSFCLAHLIVKFEPIGWIVDLVDPYLNTRNPFVGILWNSIKLALGCLKCCALYVGFFIGGFWCGVITSVFAYIYSQAVLPFIDGIRFR